MPIFISLLLHLAGLISLDRYDPTTKESAPPVEIEIKSTSTTPPGPKNKSPTGKINEVSDVGTLPCMHYYGGIGVELMYGRDEYGNYVTSIYKIYPGYPAHKLKLLPGDIIVDQGEIRGEPGTYTTFQIIRNGVSISHMVRREKICTD